MTHFTSIAEALSAGFQIYDKTEYGWIVRIWTARGWALAVVDLR